MKNPSYKLFSSLTEKERISELEIQINRKYPNWYERGKSEPTIYKWKWNENINVNVKWIYIFPKCCGTIANNLTHKRLSVRTGEVKILVSDLTCQNLGCHYLYPYK